MPDSQKYIVLYQNDIDAFDIVNFLRSLNVDTINRLKNINYPVMTAVMTQEQRTLALQDSRIVAIDEEETPEATGPTLVSLNRKKIVGDVKDLPSNFDGTDYLGSGHFYSTDVYIEKDFISWGEAYSEAGLTDFVNYQAYSNGKNVDIVILETSNDNAPGGVEALYPDFDNHPDFLNEAGESRIRSVDWSFYSPTVTAPYNNQLNGGVKHSRHGSGTLSVAGGRYCGLAKEANLYIMHSGSGDSMSEMIDCVVQFHQTKPANPDTGFRNPTILSLSWGYGIPTQYMIPIENISQINLDDGTTLTPEPTGWDLSNFIDNGMTVRSIVDTNSNTRIWCTPTTRDLSTNLTNITLQNAFESAVAAGVHVFKSAGNDGFASAKTNQPEYNTTITVTSTEAHTAQTIPVPVTISTGTYSTLLPKIAGGSPSVNYVGAQYVSTTNKRLEEYSDRGPAVTIIGPGSSFAAYVSNTARNPSIYDSNNIPWGRFNGTSCAAPAVAGVAACLIEYYYNQTGLYPAPSILTELLQSNDFESVIDDYAFDYTSPPMPRFDLDLEWGRYTGVSPYRQAFGLFKAANSFPILSDDVRLFTNVIEDNIQNVEVLLPTTAKKEEVVPKFFFGLNTANALSEIQSESKALVNLGIDIDDLDIIRGIRGLGVDRDDLKTISGLDFDAIPELASIEDSYLSATGIILQQEGVKVYSEFKISNDSSLVSKGYKYKYFDFDTNTIKFADVSTSRISSWSSFSELDLTVPIFYGGDVTVKPAPATNKSTISLAELTTNVEPEARRYAAEIPTDLVTITVDGVEHQVYAMRGIPLTFNCIFRRIFLGQVTHKIVQLTENDPLPTWTVKNIDDNSVFEFEDLDVEDSIQFYDYRVRERELSFYYNPAQIEKLNIAGIFTREFPPVTINNLKSLDISRNDFIELPDINFIAPTLEVLDISSQSLMRSRNDRTARQQFATLPPTLKELTANGCISSNRGLQSEVPDMSHLVNLKKLSIDAQGARSKLQLGEAVVLPRVGSNFVNNPLIDIQDAAPGEYYAVISTGDWGESEWDTFNNLYPWSILQSILDRGKTPVVRAPFINYFTNITSNPPQLRLLENDIPLTDVIFSNHGENQTSSGRKLDFTLYAAKNLTDVVISDCSIRPWTGSRNQEIKDWEQFNFQDDYEYFGNIPLEPFVSKEIVNFEYRGNTTNYVPDMRGRSSLTTFNWSQQYDSDIKAFPTSIVGNEMADFSVFKPFEGCTALTDIGIIGATNVINLADAFQGLGSLQTLSVTSSSIFGKFTSESFAGTNQIRNLNFSSKYFGISTTSGIDIADLQLFESDCFRTIPALEDLEIQGIPPESENASETTVELIDGIGGTLPDFSYNLELLSISITNLDIRDGLTDLSVNTNLRAIKISQTNLSQSVPKFVLPKLDTLILNSNDLVSAVENPFPVIICRQLLTMDFGNNPRLSGPIATLAGCPFLESIVLNNCSFTSYNIRAFAQLTKLSYLKVNNNKLTTDDLRQILKDLLISYNANPRKFAVIDLSNQDPVSGSAPTLNSVLGDVQAASAYNILTKVANWSITI